jgi:hypothetical protein
MAILTATTLQPRSGEVLDDLQKLLKRIKDMVVKKGGENVTVLITVVGGEATSQLVFLTSSENWSKYGQFQDAFFGDPKAQALLREAGKLATWRTYAAHARPLTERRGWSMGWPHSRRSSPRETLRPPPTPGVPARR